MSSQTQSNDPRQPSAARPYKQPLVAPQDLPVDYSGFIAVIFGVFGAMFKVWYYGVSNKLSGIGKSPGYETLIGHGLILTMVKEELPFISTTPHSSVED
ncbi:hypothetical protein Leryth_014277 [Lithospermum erythrorhizon]|nr:hypothetical protein Leryth_014277 [Lithospermum erythrorhizon]